MAGRKDLFEAALRAGDDAAFDEDWEKAIESYMMAVREFPTSVLACNSLGLALFNAGRLEDALKAYNQAHKLDPEDPLPVEKSADVLERMGRLNDAAKQYLVVAEIYLTKHDLEKSIDNWERATRITPGLVKIHQKLAMAYERTGQRTEAVNEYLKLAFHFQNAGNGQVAMQALERAVRLDAKDPRILNAMTAVRANQAIAPELLEAPKKGPANVEEEDEYSRLINSAIADADARGPLGEAIEYSLAALAEDIFSGGSMDMGPINAMQAIELHRAGIKDEAVGAYQRAEQSGMKNPALLFNLGALLQETGHYDKAIPYLKLVAGANPTLTAGSAHTLGLCFMGQEKWEEATKMLIRALRLIDLSLSMDDQEIAELNAFYQRVISLADQTDSQTLQSFCQTISKMLTGVDWKRRVAQTRSRMSDMISEDARTAFEGIAKGEKVIDALDLVNVYSSQGKLRLAMDEALHILEQAPDFLAAHLRVAQLLMDLGRLEESIEKYRLIARTYLLRGDQSKAADILNEVIKLSPADVNLRSSLIELLEQQGRWDEVLGEYLSLAEAYRDLADTTNARLTYDLASKIARQHNAPADKVSLIYLGMGDLEMDRLDYRSALRTYQKVLEGDPGNSTAREKIIELQFRLGNALQAIEELDKLLQTYAKQRRTDLILRVLENQTEANPGEMALRARLGAVYQQTQKHEKAVEQYEELCELQLQANLQAEAVKTLHKIISLNPPRVAEYRQLLANLGG
jgi:tetratricopeptide (TPR) repeat protein